MDSSSRDLSQTASGAAHTITALLEERAELLAALIPCIPYVAAHESEHMSNRALDDYCRAQNIVARCQRTDADTSEPS